MRAKILIVPLLLVPAVTVSGWLFLQHSRACNSPIHYKIGVFDTEFGLSEDDFKVAVAAAGGLWSESVGKELFQYDPHGALTINLIYDTRQKTTEENKLLVADVHKINQSAGTIKQSYLKLKQQYENAKTAYVDASGAFNARQAAYNTEVENWNKSGGAPQDVYDRLQSEKSELILEQAILENKRLDVNDYVDQLNQFSNTYNLLVGNANATISTINKNAGKEFEEGQFDPQTNSITIYEFSTNKKLFRVLTHELGHSLGVDHNANPLSIMYPSNEASTLSLSKEDIRSLKDICRIP
jgi:predicted Zn-dependent protease